LHFSRAVPTLVLNVIRSTFVGSSTGFITKCPTLDLVRYHAIDLIVAPLVVLSDIAVGYQFCWSIPAIFVVVVGTLFSLDV
jgi:hypothetical protein